ncbi:MAG: DEAD/DEAH box helicase [Betaproteobacteria bacterium]|nr:DEAD/DEAH box helicase [Betaproteobacteria bacterium]
MSQTFFADLLPVLASRAKHAAISRLGFANVPLRRYLAEMFERPYGEPGAFLADPTFEATFGWMKADQRMADLSGTLLSPSLVRAMDEPPAELVKDYRFPQDQYPYLHQLEAWRILTRSTPQSIVVASGTGSGKTECFMVPILDQLARLREEKHGQLVGVRALFLYPLNALINSQRERLRAWTHAFDGDVRFCLYNGNTPERPDPAWVQRENPCEIGDRERLRASPPPILVTNATMLEYMLVRTADAPILAQSQGKLEWVVLDEAHTYVGSQAAEAALLIRRVLFAFGVSPDQVRFVATSATIGDPEGESGQKLKRFLAEVAGVSLEQVHLVAGQRRIPTLGGKKPKTHTPQGKLASIDVGSETSPSRYDALANDITARRLRDLFVGDPSRPPVARLSEICKTIGLDKKALRDQQLNALHWMDLLSGTRDNTGAGTDDGESFLPVRSHLFHQTMSGLWACADAQCTHKSGTVLDDKDWPFGQVYLEPRKHCDCGSPAYEVVTCSGCGAAHLQAGEFKNRLGHLQTFAALDEFELEAEPGEIIGEDDQSEDDEGSAAGRQKKVLIVNRHLSNVGPLDVERSTRLITEASDKTLRLLAQEEGEEGLSCPVCGSHTTRDERLFQASRLGAPFLLGNILPTLLEYAPDGEKPADHPCRGRRLLTFNDSRQGTARMAAKLQQDAERNRVRGLVYHLTLQHGRGVAGAQAVAIENEIKTLEQIPESARNAALNELIENKRKELMKLTRPSPIAFNDLAQYLANQGKDFDYMLAHYRRIAPGSFSDSSGPVELAKMFLVREFGRRPKRLNNLESMGLVAIRYPAIDSILLPDSIKQATDFDLSAWQDFLKLCLDFFVRGGGSLAISLNWRNWLGMPFPQTQLVTRDEVHVGKNQRRWPRARRGGLRSTLVRLLSYALKADIQTSYGEDRVDVVLLAAWDALNAAGLLQQSGDGRVLPLDRLAFAPISEAWACPVTRRFLDTTLRGLTPYLPEKATELTARCEKISLPLYEEPFAGVADELERIRLGREWLARHENIVQLREQGLWSALNDRVFELSSYFTTAEHSAQQDSRTLDRYEKAFKAGDLNLLSCSTTMEMGIDIGGISQVAMNNVPPHPANYLQRAGRAGRRRESRSLAMTLCKSNPHDQAVFSNTRWAFDTQLPAPRVSLDSPIIVQRHVHSFLLSRFLAEALRGSGQEKTRLNCGLFFLGDSPLVDLYTAWCKGLSANQSPDISRGLKQLLRHSIYEGTEFSRICDIAAESMDELARSWKLEYANLEREAQEASKESSALIAISKHMARLTDEYLLRDLSTRGYLPAYGFPTHIASFDNLTHSRDSTKKPFKAGRDDNRFRRREMPSRDLMTALREYAPGSEIVLDGLVYKSAGITLNWHIPADQENAREIQDIRLAWRCNHCGASGSSHSLSTARHCDACGADISPEHIREFLEPAGFSVDYYKEPGNDITTQHFVPVEPAWVDAKGVWTSLPNPSLGRFRISPAGHVFHQSRGIHGTGYALCLECGRAEPMTQGGELPKALEKPHFKLRSKKGECRGSNDPWRIKRGITLGHETWTDVFEIQFKLSNGIWLDDLSAARTLSVALRDALADLIGVQASELGCDVEEARPETGMRCQSILIYDRFAAGYASSVERYLGSLFHQARKRLECPTNCDSACPHCVLDFDQRFTADSLDRHAALEVLTDHWLESLRLPDTYRYFGNDSLPEYRQLPEAIWKAVTGQRANAVRLYAGGNAADWDVGISPLRQLAYRLAGQGIATEIAIPKQILGDLEDLDRHLIASLADHPQISINEIQSSPQCGQGWLLAETLTSPSSRWAFGDAHSIAFHDKWGSNSDGPLVTTTAGTFLITPTVTLTAESIRPKLLDASDCEVEIHHELDGSLQGFGTRLWTLLAESHPATQMRLADKTDDVVAVTYRDRYLFTPLSVALLADLVASLRELVGQPRWAASIIHVVTTNRRLTGENISRNSIWSDWKDSALRDQALVATFGYLGIDANVESTDISTTGHSRILEANWSSGKKHILRLDQGVSYWRAAQANSRTTTYFDTSNDEFSEIGRQLAELSIRVEGSTLPTHVFVKIRS